ncbi:hypothetical protein [Hydrogenophaga sp.]|uniref:hypothetical protein n=1 Tax=Hydrogenophaga sp. TaxID=1904254 RepID=UPI0025BDDCCF|nr:hypothetical protein [Hydrogenophaga sp.]MBT9466704.1 hypothetical protein [Hydrogenophaga sp.]
MKISTGTWTKRITTWVLLMVWVFGVASGVANACLLESPARHISAVQDEHSNTGKGSCLKVCDEGAQALPKACSIVDHVEPGWAPWFATLWTGSSQSASYPGRTIGATVPIVGLPLRVRYSRLAL